MVGAPLGAETGRQPGDREPPAFLDPGAAQHQGRARAEMRDRDDQARRAIRIFVGAGVELGERAERGGIADQREARLLGRIDQRDAGMEAQEWSDRPARQVAPQRRVAVEQAERDGGRGAPERRGRRQRDVERHDASGLGHRGQHGAEGRLSGADRIGEAGRERLRHGCAPW